MSAVLLESPQESAAFAALVEQLYRVPENGKAEIVEGKVVRMSPTGDSPGRASGRIYASLLNHEDEIGGGRAYPDNVGFVVSLPARRSFSPDAAWMAGTVSGTNMKFRTGSPTFAVEVRSEGDYGPKAERQIQKKIADYLAAGTKVVWDVDILGSDIIRVYSTGVEGVASIFRRGDVADAEPAVPGWRFPVDMLFR